MSAIDVDENDETEEQVDVDDAQTSSHLTKKIAANYPGSNADSDTASGGQQLCDVHAKSVQGYCLEDRRVLCIDCILW